MKIVSYSEAARIAGVSRQRMNGMKKEDDSGRYSRPFFLHDPKSGKAGVDIESPHWISYVNSTNGKRVNKKPQQKSTKRQDKSGESDNSAGLSTLISILFSIAQEVFQADDETMGEYKRRVVEKYRGMNEST